MTSSPWSIRMQGVGKRYRLGGRASMNDNFREDVMNSLRGLFGRGAGSSSKGDFWALNDINLEIAQGESVGIIGRNGAGKSTLLKILSRITTPTCGEMQYRGRLASLLEVGTGFHRELTGRENIFVNGAILGMRRREIDQALDAIVEFAGVERFLDTPVKFYSSGMYVRLAFAVAAHLNTDILVVDEVLAVGDAEFQSKCLGKMQDVASHGRTVLFVSHNMAAVEAMCTRGVVLDGGRCIHDGPTSTAVEAYTRSFRSGITKDLLTCRLDGGTGGGRLTSMHVINERGESNGSIRAGDQVTLKFGYRSDHPIRKPRILIGVYDLAGAALLRFDSDFVSIPSMEKHTEGTLTLKTGRWMMTPGEVTVNIAYFGDGDWLAYYKDVCQVTVDSGSFSGGNVFARRDTLFQVEQEWSLEPS